MAWVRCTLSLMSKPLSALIWRVHRLGRRLIRAPGRLIRLGRRLSALSPHTPH